MPKATATLSDSFFPNIGISKILSARESTAGETPLISFPMMSAALSSVLNGGTYYQPYIIESQTGSGINHQTKPVVVKKNVISPSASVQIQSLLQYVFNQNYGVYSAHLHPGYTIGGKTGTAQIPQPGGGYKDNVYNGTFLGYVGGNKPQYAVAVLVNTPDLPGYDSAGAQAAAPIFGNVEDMLINDFNVVPITP